MSALPRPRGDEGDLFRSLSGRLLGRVTRRVRTSPANVEDACSFAWTQLLAHQPDREQVTAWLTTVAVNEALRLNRVSRGAASLDGLTEAGREPAERRDATAATPERLDARAQLARLRPRGRRLLMLQAAGFSYAEISNLTGESSRAIERHILRSRRVLRAGNG